MELFSKEALIKSLGYMPDRVTEIESWHRHIPFAYWLLGALKPNVLVELGTHRGDSYCCFCQAVESFKLATKCYAVDTWEGDSQAGYYGAEILQDLRTYHDPKYGTFSTLLQNTFDQALGEFEEGSIDLLHIDGLHTYEAVKHDFLSWKPKLSERAVVLFHDTSVREGDFGVWRLWEELREDYPGFNFEFGYGLGVLLVGSKPEVAVSEFLDVATKDSQLISTYFERMGDAIALRRANEQLAGVVATKDRLGQDLQLARDVVVKRDSELEKRDKEREKLGKDLTHARNIVAERDETLQQQFAELLNLREELEKTREQKSTIESERVALEKRAEAQKEEFEKRAEAQKEEFEKRIAAQKRQIVKITDAYTHQQAQLKLVRNSRVWQLRNSLAKILGKPSINLDTQKPDVPVWETELVEQTRCVDIIIPVYAGLEETKNCIESVLSSTFNTDAEIIVINDASPQPELVEYLISIEDKVTLLHNETNRGFVATVNRGMKQHPNRDILLLNSDTRVANDWLDRIRSCAYSSKNVASVTPFSNNATICSYPVFCQDNEIPKGFDEVSLDQLFSEVNQGQSVAIPTGVGFCMYIRRDCLQQVGAFDEVLFGRGYGEENEFCMRSAEAGWQHLLCADTFVYHAGGVSFADTQNEHQQAGSKALNSLYPDYNAYIQSFVHRDAIAPLRFALDLRIRTGVRKPVVLMINHSRGGGTERHLSDLAEQLSDKLTVLMLHPYGAEGAAAYLTVYGCDAGNKLIFDPLCDYEELLTLLKMAGVARIHFHHTIGVHPRFWNLPEDLSVPFDYTVHDYYLACPQITMTNEEGSYCGEPDDAGCNQCLSTRPAPGNGGIDHWREENGRFLYAAERVFVPSQDAARRVQRYFPGVNTVCIPHDQGKLEWSGVHARPLASDETLRIVVLGALSLFKGADLLESCALQARKRRSLIEFHLIGYAYRKLASYPMSNLHVHGQYQESELERLINEVDPHLVWFPGDCPETYSYTLSTCLDLGLPVVAPKLGAFPERLTNRNWTWLTETGMQPEGMADLFAEIRGYFNRSESPQPIFSESGNDQRNYDSDYFKMSAAGVEQINWFEFHKHLQALSVLRLGITQRGSTGLKHRIYTRLQQIKSRPILAKFLRFTPIKWTTRVKQWLLGL